jgi:hypothetical protein
MVSHDTFSDDGVTPMRLDAAQLALVAGGSYEAWRDIGRAVADGYQWAVAQTTDAIEWVANQFD